LFADQIADAVDTVYSGRLTGAIDYLVAIYGFAWQIYGDFSGYTDMAIALALMLGIRLPNNFRQPYCAASIVEFWRRWHITLSRWLRDYIYIPLGGNRHGRTKQSRNILITMAIGGLWHGANWTFLAWGLLHGAFIALSHRMNRVASWRRAVRAVPRWIAVLVTFHIVAAFWILFRAPDMGTAWRVASGPFVAPVGDIAAALSVHGFAIALMVLMAVTHRYDSHGALRLIQRRLRPAVVWPAVACLWAVAIAVNTGSSAKFIYFDF